MRLPGEAVDALSLAVLKARLDGALGNLVWGRCPCPWQGLGFGVPSNPKHSDTPLHTPIHLCLGCCCFLFFFSQRNKYKNIHSTERPPYSVRSSVWISSVCDLSLTATRQFCYVTINIICNTTEFWKSRSIHKSDLTVLCTEIVVYTWLVSTVLATSIDATDRYPQIDWISLEKKPFNT